MLWHLPVQILAHYTSGTVQTTAMQPLAAFRSCSVDNTYLYVLSVVQQVFCMLHNLLHNLDSLILCAMCIYSITTVCWLLVVRCRSQRGQNFVFSLISLTSLNVLKTEFLPRLGNDLILCK